MPTSVFAYILAPCWRAMQALLVICKKYCDLLDLHCNTLKTVCMVFAPRNKCRVVCNSFPNFVLDGQLLQFVSEFHYLGNIITNLLCDDADFAHYHLSQKTVIIQTLQRL